MVSPTARRPICQQQLDLKQKRYMCIIILMLSKLDPHNGMAKLRERRPDLATPEDLDVELRTELFNCYVFASEAVLVDFAAFIAKPGRLAFVRVATAMRQDLWGRGADLSSVHCDEMFNVLMCRNP
jgi:hypothetical protein